jgi:hypothetical protein
LVLFYPRLFSRTDQVFSAAADTSILKAGDYALIPCASAKGNATEILEYLG